MKGEYQVPVDFGEASNAPPARTTTSSVASSSRVASAASAPVRSGKNKKDALSGRNKPTIIHHAKPGGSLNSYTEHTNDGGGGTVTPGANSIRSSPNVWNSSTPQRIKTRREFEQKIRQRRHRAGVPNFPRDLNVPDRKPENSKRGGTDTPALGGLPLPKPLTDLLLQTAMAGIGTTAKLSKPGLAITKNTLLPHLILPLLKEIWEQYAPIRLQTWTKVVPTSLKNLADLLWDTEAGKALGEKAGQLGENVVDMASSEVARQCWIDATIALIKLMEGLHTPEVKALLDQYAVGACRFVDVLSSGKAKQVWFDLSDATWALIEVGSDPVMITSLAEGCAQICFALERERESLKKRRSLAASSSAAGGAGGVGDGDGDARLKRVMASRKRRERDQRQMGTYPPGKRVVSKEGGRLDFEEALLDGLEGIIDRHDEDQEELEDIMVHDNADNTCQDNGGPPQRVIVPTASSENIQKVQSTEVGTQVDDDADNNIGGGLEIVNDDESEITTEIEDLRVSSRGQQDQTANYDDDDDVSTQSSAGDERVAARKGDATELAYEPDGNMEYATSLQNEMDQLEWRPHDDGTASEMYDAFDEPVLHFYRRLNEVLVETRKQGNFDVQHPARDGHSTDDDGKLNVDGSGAADTAPGKDAVRLPAAAVASKGLFGVQKKWWKLLIIAFVFGVATMCTVWFALGCYGFYVIFLGGMQTFPTLSPLLAGNQQQQSNTPIIIQLVTSRNQDVNVFDECIENSGKACTNKKNDQAASISLGDWYQLKLDVDTIISQSSEKAPSRIFDRDE